MTFTDRAESLGKRSVPDGFEDPTELRITYQGKAYLAAIRHLTIKALEILVTMCAFSTARQPVDWRAARAEALSTRKRCAGHGRPLRSRLMAGQLP